MTRRSPPSALRLVPGPAPPRNIPKHTLPSVPRPTFHPPSIVAKEAPPRGSWRTLSLSLPAFLASFKEEKRLEPVQKRSAAKVRGPWDHSGTISVSIDVDALLRPPLPVAVGPVSR